MVTVTDPATGTTRTGRAVELTTGPPGIVIEQDDGLRVCLPQSFTVTDASADEGHEALAAALPAEWVRAAEGWYSMHGAGLVRNLLAGAAPLIAADALERLAARFDEFGEAEFRDAARMAREAASQLPGCADGASPVRDDPGSQQEALTPEPDMVAVAASDLRRLVEFAGSHGMVDAVLGRTAAALRPAGPAGDGRWDS